ncbi:lipase maturation factor family protein [Rhodococcus triatomae]|nr:lipase maturation factor family protein [Rhodococcus triatomae]QNG20893.1 lipase maturation factor family protein [Rhodococcus triatomae]QNG23192.1 lipase maturation factor family protein [Rhodococcus triatomae]
MIRRLFGCSDEPPAARPPAHVRARMYRYRFSTRRERREAGAWWVRFEL